MMLFSNAIVVTKYVSIFWLKNPFGFQDEFWSLFVNVWIVSVSFLAQFVLDFLPGSRGIAYPLCSGLNFTNHYTKKLALLFCIGKIVFKMKESRILDFRFSNVGSN